MHWSQCNRWVRQAHRWISIIFTLAVLANGVTILQGKYSPKHGLVAAFFLAFLLFTGLYLFALPYFVQWRNRHPAA